MSIAGMRQCSDNWTRTIKLFNIWLWRSINGLFIIDKICFRISYKINNSRYKFVSSDWITYFVENQNNKFRWNCLIVIKYKYRYINTRSLFLIKTEIEYLLYWNEGFVFYRQMTLSRMSKWMKQLSYENNHEILTYSSYLIVIFWVEHCYRRFT